MNLKQPVIAIHPTLRQTAIRPLPIRNINKLTRNNIPFGV